MHGEEQAELLAAQVEEQAQQLPELEHTLLQAQTAANNQRTSVTQVQQRIQVLAAEQRSIEEQFRQASTRRERLGADRNAMAAPDETRLQELQDQCEAAQEAAAVADARLQELQEALPQRDDARRAQQQVVNAESCLLYTSPSPRD